MGLAAFFEASAQCCAIAKALTKGGTETPPPYAVLSKLSVGVVDKCRLALDTIEPPVLAFVGTAFHECVAFMKELNIALANYYHAEVHYAAGECGLAISYYRRAMQALREQSPPPSKEPHNHSAPGLPRMNAGEFGAVAASVRSLFVKVDRQTLRADNENKLVYFQDVPSDIDRPPVPGGVCIMNRKTLDVSAMEQSGPVVLFYKVDGVPVAFPPSRGTTPTAAPTATATTGSRGTSPGGGVAAAAASDGAAAPTKPPKPT